MIDYILYFQAAAWTFFGGLIFGGAYLFTRGGLLVPIALHFGNNALVFGASLFKVADAMSEQRAGYLAVSQRMRAAAATARDGAPAPRGVQVLRARPPQMAAAERSAVSADLEGESARTPVPDDLLIIPMHRHP